MHGVRRALVLGALWAAACTDATFDMLPKPPAPAGGSTAGSGASAAAGRGDAGRSMGLTGGMSGRGSGGSAGFGALGDGGDGDESMCPPQGCEPHCVPLPGTFGCSPCSTDDECTAKGGGRCSDRYGCVECLPNPDCTTPGCDAGCGATETCDEKTYTCQIDCHSDLTICPPGRLVCDPHRFVCVECNPDLQDSGCASDLRCNANGACVECATPTDCQDAAKPVCDAAGACVECVTGSNCQDPAKPACSNFMCRPCMANSECNPPGTAGPLARVCYQGKCMAPASAPPSP